MTRLLRYSLVGFCLAFLLVVTSSNALADNILLTVDENGNGTLVSPFVSGPLVLPSSLAQDPGPGGLAGALTYNLLNPPGLVIGDVILTEGGVMGNLCVSTLMVHWFSILSPGKERLPTLASQRLSRLTWSVSPRDLMEHSCIRL